MAVRSDKLIRTMAGLLLHHWCVTVAALGLVLELWEFDYKIYVCIFPLTLQHACDWLIFTMPKVKVCAVFIFEVAFQFAAVLLWADDLNTHYRICLYLMQAVHLSWIVLALLHDSKSFEVDAERKDSLLTNMSLISPLGSWDKTVFSEHLVKMADANRADSLEAWLALQQHDEPPGTYPGQRVDGLC